MKLDRSLRQERRLKVFENWILQRIFPPRRDKCYAVEEYCMRSGFIITCTRMIFYLLLFVFISNQNSVHSFSWCAGLDTVLRCLLYRDEVPSSEWILFNHQLGPLAKVSLVFFFAVVPVVVAIWDYYGFLVCRDSLYFFLGWHPWWMVLLDRHVGSDWSHTRAHSWLSAVFRTGFVTF
jgi:hypothetical protein